MQTYQSKNRIKILLFLTPLWLLIILAFFVPYFSVYDINLGSLSALYEAPNLEHFFGTDNLGRDLFTRLFYALRSSIFIGFSAALLTILLAVFYVFLARFCEALMRFLDMFLALPFLLLMMFFQSFISGGYVSMILLIALVHWPFVAKLLASELKRLECLEFYQAALVLGSSKTKAFFSELLPPCFSILMVLFILNIIHAISTEATLSFFGLGLAFEIPSLGTMLNDASKAIFLGAWWLVIFPLLALLLLILPLLFLSAYLQKYFGIKL